MKPIAKLIIVAALACGSAQVEAQPLRGRGPPPGEGPGMGGGALFISPSGEPFRSGPGQPYPSAAWFAGADKNGDGALDRDEFRADADRFFKALDVDHDGELGDRELTRYETVVAPEILGIFRTGAAEPRMVLAQLRDDIPTTEGRTTRIPDWGRRGGPPLEGAAAFTPLAVPQPVRAADENFDRKITGAEFARAADRRFKLLDRDGDGKLLLAELPTTAAQRMLEAGGGKKKRRL